MDYKRLKDLRLYEDMSQQEVANLIKCHLNTYRKYESGAWEIPLSKALIIASLHNVCTDYLFGLTDQKGKFTIQNVLLCKRMKYLRRKNGFTQKKLAEIIFCRPLTYQRYELGYEETPVITIEALAKLFKVSTDNLIGAGELD